MATEILHTTPPDGNFTPLEEIPHDKYLGVTIDNKLTFNQHIDTVTKKATNLLNLCRRNLYMCPKEVKEAAYKSIVRPHLEYASAAWSPHTQKNIDKIESVHRRAARFVLGNHNYGPNSGLTNQIKETLKWPTLHHRRIAHDIHILYKIINKLLNISLPQIVHKSPTNPHRFLHIQALNSDAFKYSFYARTTRFWNKIPPNICQITSFPSFKTQSAKFVNSCQIAKQRNTWMLIWTWTDFNLLT